MIALFKAYPQLEGKLPYVSLGEFPTPVQRLGQLSECLGIRILYMKRDDLSGKVYGGNKVRKLEFLLGDALRAKVKEVLTFGGVGSNHALATAIYAQQVGLRSISMLMPQPNAHYLRRNLLMSHYCGAELHLLRSARLDSRGGMPMVFLGTMSQLLRHRLRYGSFPKVIPVGGSSPLGTVGFVSAAFELKEQIMKGEIPEPDYIYVASGSMGTAAGLVLGLRAANLRSQLISVRVNGENFVNTKGMVKLIGKTNRLLCSLDSSFPMIDISEADIHIRHDFFGQRYALFTKEGIEAIARVKECAGIKLEGTYTGKTMAALIDDAKNGGLQDKVVLFWNTANSRDFSDVISTIDYHSLPRCFHRYFEEEVQPLDRDL